MLEIKMIALMFLVWILGLLLGVLIKPEPDRRTWVFEDFLKRNKMDLMDTFLEEIEFVHGLPVWEVKDLLKKHGYEESIIMCDHIKLDYTQKHAVWRRPKCMK